MKARFNQPKASWTSDEGGESVGQSADEGGRRPRTHRCKSQNMERAVSAGIRVEATLIAITGPKRRVTGDMTRPMAGTLVSVRRFNPPGWNSQFELRSWWPWIRA